MAHDRITKLYISGLRVIEDVTLDLDGLTVLIGNNGTGKSSILEALELLRNAGKAIQFVTDVVMKAHGGLRCLMRKGQSTSFAINARNEAYDMIFKRKNAFHVSKNEVDMWVYNGKEQLESAAVAYQETRVGHGEEFRHSKSAFVYYIIEGSGEWLIEDESFRVEATDVVIVPPGKRFYYRGNLKQVCITAPAWEPQYEEVVRKVDLG